MVTRYQGRTSLTLLTLSILECGVPTEVGVELEARLSLELD